MSESNWNRFCDFIWPTLRGNVNDEKNLLKEDDCKFIDEANIDLAIEVALRYAKCEDERRNSVENKAALFIGAFSVAVTIFVSTIKDFILSLGIYPIALNGTVVLFTSIVIVYLCRATLYAVDTLQRKSYTAIAVPEFLYSNDSKYKIKLFLELRNSIYSNFSVINQKVDSMTMAQEFFKCAVRTVVLLAFILMIFFIIA